MIQKKSFLNTIKRALQSGTFNYVGQQAKEIPKELFHIDTLQFQDQSWWQCNPITKIDVSNNQISYISEQIINLPDIQLIRAKNNLVQMFPKAVLLLQNLKSIDLSKNKLCQLPAQLQYSKTLVEINFAQNNIELVPNLSKIDTLEVIFLNDNKLKALPCFGKNIKKIEASNNKIPLIRREMFITSKTLQILNLNKNLIEHIEEGSFSNALNMISLELKQNRLIRFNQVPKSQKLDTINLAFNRITQYTQFQNSPNLTVLILSDNKIKILSKDIFKLSNLKTLDVSNNDLSDLPCQIGFINSLVRIQLQGNPLKSIRQNIKTGGTNIVKKYLRDKASPAQKEAIQSKTSTSFQHVSQNQYWAKLINQFNQGGELILRNLDLKEIDNLVYEKNLKGLNLSDNRISQLSENIGKLQTLKYLIINKNQLEKLPLSLGIIKSLQTIQAKNNRLSGFGDNKNYSLNAYPFLNYLDLSANKFNQIPKAILLLKNLRTLHLSYNSIRSIDVIWQNNSYLPKLQVLDVSNNAINDISDSIYNKLSLNYLTLENNNLTKLPTVIGFMRLSGLKVDGNPLKLIKRTVIEKGTVALLQFLRTKHSGDIPELHPQRIEQKIQIEESIDQTFDIKKIGHQQNQYKNQPQKHQQKEEKYPINNYNNQWKQQQIPQQIKIDRREIQFRVKQIQKQISQIQKQIELNMSMNNMVKTQKKKQMQALMIQRNKLLKS